MGSPHSKPGPNYAVLFGVQKYYHQMDLQPATTVINGITSTYYLGSGCNTTVDGHEVAATTSTMTSLSTSTSGIATAMASPTPSYAMSNAKAKITSPSLVSYNPTAIATITTNGVGVVGSVHSATAVLAMIRVMVFAFGFKQ